MISRMTLFGLLSVVTLAVAAYGVYRLGVTQGMQLTAVWAEEVVMVVEEEVEDPSQWTPVQREEATQRHMDTGVKAGDRDPVTGLEVLYYYDPMLPDSKFEMPGKSPFMNMLLVPAYADVSASADSGTVEISARIQQNSGIRTAAVMEGSLEPRVQAVGVISWNEREAAVLQARATGFIEVLHVRAALDRVTEGQPLADIYVPEWVAVQNEYLALSRMQGSDLEPLMAAARTRMRQAGMVDEQIRVVTESGQAQPRVTLRSPITGLVSELGVREGMTFIPGMTLFRLNGTSTVWAEAEVPESQTGLLREGAAVKAVTPSMPERVFEGALQSLLPQLDPTLRTRRARLELANPAGQLVPGMLVHMELSADKQDRVLLIPTEALIATGSRTVVMVDEGEGNFRPTDVISGAEFNGQTVIVSGLRAGQRVVTSGQFLIDSEASLRGLETRLQATTEQEP